jgi:hypothetical protein
MLDVNPRLQNSFNKETTEMVSKWVKDNEVDNFEAYGDHKVLKSDGLPEELINQFIDFDNVDLGKDFDAIIDDDEKNRVFNRNNIKNTHDWYRNISMCSTVLLVLDQEIGSPVYTLRGFKKV